MKPFDIEAAKRREAVITKYGDPVKIICFDRRGGCGPIVGLVVRGDCDNVRIFSEDGYDTDNGQYLFMAPKKVTKAEQKPKIVSSLSDNEIIEMFYSNCNEVIHRPIVGERILADAAAQRAIEDLSMPSTRYFFHKYEDPSERAIAESAIRDYLKGIQGKL